MMAIRLHICVLLICVLYYNHKLVFGNPTFRIKRQSVDQESECMNPKILWSSSTPAFSNTPYFTTGSYDNNQYCTWLIQAPPDRHVRLKFLEFDIEFEDYCQFDNISIYDGDSDSAPLFGPFCGNDNPDPYYYIQDGYYGTEPMFTSGTEPMFSSGTEPMFTYQTPNGFFVSSGSSLFIKFISDFTVTHKGALWQYATVDTVNPTATVTTVAAETTPPQTFPTPTTLPTQTDVTTIPLESECMNPEILLCSSTLAISNTPNFHNGNYHNNQHCTWLIQAAPNERIFVEFLQFDLEHEFNCLYDSISIYNGDSDTAQRIGTFCGNGDSDDNSYNHYTDVYDYSQVSNRPTLNRPLISSGNTLFIRFISDESMTHLGAQWQYKTVDVDMCPSGTEITVYDTCVPCPVGTYRTLSEEDLCTQCPDGYTTEGVGSLTAMQCLVPVETECMHPKVLESSTTPATSHTPNFLGGLYDNNQNCTWLIHARTDEQILFEFLQFNIEYVSDCYFDSISVYDGNSRTAPLIGTFCGLTLNGENFTYSTMPEDPIISSGNELFVEFTTDGSVTYKGAQWQYTSIDTSYILTTQAAIGETTAAPTSTSSILEVTLTGTTERHVCKGEDVNFRWTYDDSNPDKDFIEAIQWSKDPSGYLIMQYETATSVLSVTSSPNDYTGRVERTTVAGSNDIGMRLKNVGSTAIDDNGKYYVSLIVDKVPGDENDYFVPYREPQGVQVHVCVGVDDTLPLPSLSLVYDHDTNTITCSGPLFSLGNTTFAIFDPSMNIVVSSTTDLVISKVLDPNRSSGVYTCNIFCTLQGLVDTPQGFCVPRAVSVNVPAIESETTPPTTTSTTPTATPTTTTSPTTGTTTTSTTGITTSPTTGTTTSPTTTPTTSTPATTTQTTTTQTTTTSASSTPTSTEPTTPSAGFTCPSTYGYYPDPQSCTNYYQCSNHIAYLMSCPPDLYWNQLILTCDSPHNVAC